MNKKLTTLIVALLAVVAVSAVLYATRWGVGVSPDSTVYVGAARTLAEGRGLVALDARTGTLTPLTHYPPLYPATLALGTATGLDTHDGARWLNALLFGATILLAGFALTTYARDSVLTPVLCSFLLLASPDLLKVHSMAWSEPLFIFTCLAGLVLLALYLDGRGRALLFASATALALCFLTRYAGAATVAAGALSLLAFGRGKLSRRLLDASLLSLVACLPLALWLLRNSLVGSGATNRSFDFHPVILPHLRAALAQISAWLVGGKPRGALWVAVLFAEATAATVLLIRVLKDRGAPRASVVEGGALRRLPHVLATFVVFYFGLLVFNAFFVEFDSVFDERALAPAHAAALPLAFCLAGMLWRNVRPTHAVRLAAAILCTLLVGSHLARGLLWLRDAGRDGQVYASRAWRESETMARVRSLPHDALIYSNGHDAVYFLAGRAAHGVPPKVVRGTGRESHDYRAELQAMRGRMEQENGVLVYLRTLSERDFYLPSESELKENLRLRLVEDFADGAIYEVER